MPPVLYLYRTHVDLVEYLGSVCTENKLEAYKEGVSGGSRVSGGVISDDYPSMCCIGKRM